MKKIIILFLITSIFSTCGKEFFKTDTETDEATEIPRLAFKMLIDSELDSCPMCAKKTQTEALSILNRKYKVGRTLRGTELCGFNRIKECGPNEFVLSCYNKRELYVSPRDKIRRYFPMLIFRFHTENKNLKGIAKDDFTDERFSRLIKGNKRGAVFNGEIQIIGYQYGDGPAYNYFSKKNQIQVHCRILNLRNAVSAKDIEKNFLL